MHKYAVLPGTAWLPPRQQNKPTELLPQQLPVGQLGSWAVPDNGTPTTPLCPGS